LLFCRLFLDITVWGCCRFGSKSLIEDVSQYIRWRGCWKLDLAVGVGSLYILLKIQEKYSSRTQDKKKNTGLVLKDSNLWVTYFESILLSWAYQLERDLFTYHLKNSQKITYFNNKLHWKTTFYSIIFDQENPSSFKPLSLYLDSLILY
jgi:hypothetical protein